MRVRRLMGWFGALWALTAIMLAACREEPIPAPAELTPTSPAVVPPVTVPAGETATVTFVVDGDTIDVVLNNIGYRVRYIGINTPERDQPCYDEATAANFALVAGQNVTLVRDVSEVDQFGRLLRYVYLGGTFVNAELVRHGWAEAVAYPPDTANVALFDDLEDAARVQALGCWPSGVFVAP